MLSLPQRSEESIAVAKTMRSEHPEWFDQDGLYIGPSNEGTTLPAESQNPNEDEPIFLEPESEDRTDNPEEAKENGTVEEHAVFTNDAAI